MSHDASVHRRSGASRVVGRPDYDDQELERQRIECATVRWHGVRFGVRMRVLVTLCALVCALTAYALRAQTMASTDNPRYGRWLLKSDAVAPSSNVMTYEPFGTRGMKVTIQAVNAKGDTTRWWYTTEFDGKDMPVTGNASQSHAAVRAITPLINEIINKNNGKVTTRLTNVLSPDYNTIAVMYMRDDGAGHTTGVTFATYERMH